MIILHHLEKSRSHRILWLLEELELDYEIKIYKRNPKTLLAPKELKKIHPLGKSPIITDGPNIIAESSVIIEYLLDHYGQGKLRPEKDSEEYMNYLYFLHAAEASFMNYPFLSFVMSRLSKPPIPIFIRPIAKILETGLKKNLIGPNLKSQLQFIDKTLSQQAWFSGSNFSAADIQMSYPLLAAQSRTGLNSYPNIQKFIHNIKQRSAYQKAILKGGPVEL